MSIQSHEDYFATQPAALRERLEQIQQEVERQVPEATRTIGYKMPAFRLDRNFFYFAAFKKHIGIYPPIKDDLALVKETTQYRGPKGNLSFPHDKTLDLRLIGKIARSLASQSGRK